MYGSLFLNLHSGPGGGGREVIVSPILYVQVHKESLSLLHPVVRILHLEVCN